MTETGTPSAADPRTCVAEEAKEHKEFVRSFVLCETTAVPPVRRPRLWRVGGEPRVGGVTNPTAVSRRARVAPESWEAGGRGLDGREEWEKRRASGSERGPTLVLTAVPYHDVAVGPRDQGLPLLDGLHHDLGFAAGLEFLEQRRLARCDVPLNCYLQTRRGWRGGGGGGGTREGRVGQSAADAWDLAATAQVGVRWVGLCRKVGLRERVEGGRKGRNDGRASTGGRSGGVRLQTMGPGVWWGSGHRHHAEEGLAWRSDARYSGACRRRAQPWC